MDGEKLELVKELWERFHGRRRISNTVAQQENSAFQDQLHTEEEDNTTTTTFGGGIQRIIYKPEKKLAYFSFSSTEEAIPIYKHLLEHKNKLRIHVQYAKERPYSNFLNGLSNLVADKNIERIQSIPGLKFYEEFITKEEEETISASIYKLPHHNKRFSEGIGRDIKRKVWHFGYEFKYSNNSAGRPSIPLPDCAQSVVNRLIGLGQRDKFMKKDTHYRFAKGDLRDFQDDELELHSKAYLDIPNQCTVNEYQVGEGISPHVDNAEDFSSWIASLSMLSASVMCFKDPETKDRIEVILPRRSLIVLTGDSRYRMLHSIPQRQFDAINGKLQKREI
eukprot:CAMPEP_0117434880 /NCGR_PEP_ID=MMETSP0759-20121206/182_1 /TAXON_ID=63605 /ORGANISM="Percolomonas cosmopolitus, Strain WS" /LENGTH=334 /DNA_ID=CAMNT_0005226387 /DNA_START=1772 /DNA_END=2773 /DNA_ORIENTATION=+